MSLPITPTPELIGKDADGFLKRVEEGLKNPVGPVPTPKLGKALEKMLNELPRPKQHNSRTRRRVVESAIIL